VRFELCCALRRVMQFLPELVKQCICVSFTNLGNGGQAYDILARPLK
jgi:hypothetical protein